jgi:glycerol-3-phosphate dehydrogenase
MEQLLKELALQYPEFSIQTIEYIGKNYGVDSHSVLNIAQQDKALAEVLMHDGEILAEVVYAIEHEMAQSLTDVLFRRTGIGTLGYPGDDVFKKVITLCKTYFEWDDTQQQNEVELAMKHFKLPV